MKKAVAVEMRCVLGAGCKENGYIILQCQGTHSGEELKWLNEPYHFGVPWLGRNHNGNIIPAIWGFPERGGITVAI